MNSRSPLIGLDSGIERLAGEARHRAWFFLAMLGSLMTLTSLSTDVYLPAMPQMHMDLQGDVELTITGFLIGFALAQLVWGPLSDRIGRRLPLALGMVLFVLGSAGCALSGSIEQIVAWRVVEAMGACTGPMLARAMVRDLYGRTEAARVLSTLTMIMAIAPIVGPLLGGQMLRIDSWHGIFWLLAVLGLLLLLALVWLPETQSPAQRSRTPLTTAFADYVTLLFQRAFMRPTLSVMFFYMGVYAFIAGSPAVYIRHFGIAPQAYGWLFGLNIAGVMLLSFANRMLVQCFRLDTLLRAATAIAAVAMGVGMVLAASPTATLLAVVLPIFVCFSMNGIIAASASASATAAALDGVPHLAGSASALMGALQYGSGIVPSALLAWLGGDSPLAMVWIMGICVLLSAALALAPTTVCSPTQEIAS